MKTPKILFILKKREKSWGNSYSNNIYRETYSSGLLNSAKFVNDLIKNLEYNSELVEVTDNNNIDSVVTKYKPTHVIIEALWVIPSKFEILTKLHPNVKWIIRLHSEIPFIANEGIAINWLYEYLKFPNISIACNSKRIKQNLEKLTNKEILYLPNYYPINELKISFKHNSNKNEINIGCFGAIRPLKNQLTQAVAAIQFADKINKKLNFHINGTRIEGSSDDSILKNIKSLFNNSKHDLIEHSWLCHKDFLKLVSTMDIGLQVSFSETYNIIAADFITAGIPIVTSSEVKIVNNLYHAECTSIQSIMFKLKLSLICKWLTNFLNNITININNTISRYYWNHWLKSL